MFSLLELVLLLGVGCAIGLVALRRLKPQMQRALAAAPPEAKRTQAQRTLHWASLATLLAPLGYVFAVDGTHFLAVLITLTTHAAATTLLFVCGLRYTLRLWLLPLITLFASTVGAFVSVWPSPSLAGLRAAPWVLLLATSVAITLSTALSVLSFPLGFGQRAK